MAERNGKKRTDSRDIWGTGLGKAEERQKETSRRLMALSWVTAQRESYHPGNTKKQGSRGQGETESSVLPILSLTYR